MRTPRLTEVFVIRESDEDEKRDEFIRRLLSFYHESEAESIVDELLSKYDEDEVEEYIEEIEKRPPKIKRNPPLPYDPWHEFDVLVNGAFSGGSGRDPNNFDLSHFPIKKLSSPNLIGAFKTFAKETKQDIERHLESKKTQDQSFKKTCERAHKMCEYAEDVLIPQWESNETQKYSEHDILIVFGICAYIEEQTGSSYAEYILNAMIGEKHGIF